MRKTQMPEIPLRLPPYVDFRAQADIDSLREKYFRAGVRRREANPRPAKPLLPQGTPSCLLLPQAD